MTENDSHYWDLDIPGLSERQARRLATLIRNSGEVGQVILSNPSLVLTLRLDRRTVEALRTAILAGEASNLDRRDEDVIRGVVEDLDDWLASNTPP